MDANRHFAGIGRQVGGHDGQPMQHFVTNSPWKEASVYEKIQEDICEKAHKIACELEAKHESRVPGTVVEELRKYVDKRSRK